MSTSSKRPSKTSQPPPRSDEEAYIRRSDQANRDYEKKYREWIQSLTPEERAKLNPSLLQPVHETHRVSGHAPSQDRDMAESSLASVTPDISGSSEEPSHQESTQHMSPAVIEIVQRVIGSLISEQNVKISTTALAFALGLDQLNGLGSLRQAAKGLCVSVEALSKKKREWEKELGIPPNAFAKSEKAKAALKTAQATKHWKKKKWKPLPPALAARR